MNILITGATGLIGRQLGKCLVQKGHHITVISRDEKKAKMLLPFPCEVIEGDLTKSPVSLLKAPTLDAIIHLMGESVADGRWSAEKKQRIFDSRIKSTENLIASLLQAPQVLICASGIGIYGDRGDQELTEQDVPEDDFLATVCQEWELRANQIKEKFPNTRVVLGRIGLVLDSAGGALPKMAFPVRAGVGGKLGRGKQWLSWIHHQDLIELISFCLQNERVQGPVNFVAPEPVTNAEFSRLLVEKIAPPSTALKKWIVDVGAPSAFLKAALGEMSYVLLASQKVKPAQALHWGYAFRYSSAELALEDLCADWRNGEDVFTAEQFVPAPPETVFAFFAEAQNLEKITPPTLNFHIENMSTAKIETDTLIDYKLKIHGCPVKWKTRIADWNPPQSFVDVQEQGPYQKWHHTHRFEPLGQGTLMTDRVRYKLPLGYLGRMTAGLWVKSDVEKIFQFRRNFISNMKF